MDRNLSANLTASPASLCRIGVIDSGVGGLSVVQAIREVIPEYPIHYIGDSAWCPYGNKTSDLIWKRVSTLTEYLLTENIGTLVVACNSATIHAVGMLRSTYPLPIVGMEPAVKPACDQTTTGIVAVLATEAALAGEMFHQLLDQHARPKGVRVITRPCPEFVSLVEQGRLSGPEAEATVSEVIDPLVKENADVFVLGCTHFPFLRDLIRDRLPESVALLETGLPVARQVESQLPKRNSQIDAPKEPGRLRVETTGDLAKLKELLPILLPGERCETGHCAL